MPSRPYPLIQTLPVPKGDDAWEAKRQKILDDFAQQVPEEYYIPQHYVDNPPKDVTAIPRECGILTAAELDITEHYDAVGLAAAIAVGKYTAVAVATAFCKRAIVCDQISRCLTQWFPATAIEQAQKLDEHFQRTGKTVGPLHGVPVSIKQHMPIAGRSSDTGFVSSTVQNDKDSLMVAILRKLGAVFYVKTNQPQGIMHLESDSHLGRVLNPYNINLSAGGSTGGESALIALRGSVLGVGSDIGGSVRGPAGKAGIYGFKPTTYTLPMRDFIKGGFVAELNILCSTGPMCNTLRDMDLFMHEVLGQKPYLNDPRLVPIPWTGLNTNLDISTDKPLKVGIMMNDGVIQPQPPVHEALEWAKKRLQGCSKVELKPYTPHKAVDAMKMIRRMYWPDGGETFRAAAKAAGEPLHMLTEHILQDAEKKDAAGITADRVLRDAFRCDFAEAWTEQDVDVVLCPMYVGPAPAHDTSFYWNYTALWNFVDYPALVFPTPIRAGKQGAAPYPDEGVAPWNEQDAHVRKLWKETDYEGAPIALQLVARKYHDNFLFGALDAMKDVLGLK